MNTLVAHLLSELEYGEIQHHGNMALFPLFTSQTEGPEYLTMNEALEKRLLTITEVNHGGTVPELKAINRARLPVLLLDGEEVQGAKQNRILNTSILLKEESEAIIPVSCTEQGRWFHVSEMFADSGIIAPHRMRKEKLASVASSLGHSGRFDSDQGGIWDHVMCMSSEAGVHSNTRAMRDVFEARSRDLGEYVEAFSHVPGQKGLLVSVGRQIVGLDLISRDSAYKKLHPKLVKSYAMDAILQSEDADNGVPTPNAARAFVGVAAACEEKRYHSIGHGWDHRYSSQRMAGSALTHADTVIHAAFFGGAKDERIGGMRGYRRRRGFRMG